MIDYLMINDYESVYSLLVGSLNLIANLVINLNKVLILSHQSLVFVEACPHVVTQISLKGSLDVLIHLLVDEPSSDLLGKNEPTSKSNAFQGSAQLIQTFQLSL